MAKRDTLPRRKPLRRRSYDYSLPGDYFLTLCVSQKKCLLGRVDGGIVRLNSLGHMIQSVWERIPERYRDVQPDEFVVMPNHIHGIVRIHRDTLTDICPDVYVGDGSHSVPISIPDIIRRFKTLTTKQYRYGVEARVWNDMGTRLWQRSYFDV